jgi:hypothetical protein
MAYVALTKILMMRVLIYRIICMENVTMLVFR